MQKKPTKTKKYIACPDGDGEHEIIPSKDSLDQRRRRAYSKKSISQLGDCYVQDMSWREVVTGNIRHHAYCDFSSNYCFGEGLGCSLLRNHELVSGIYRYLRS